MGSFCWVFFLLSASAGRQGNATTHKIKENKMKNYKQTASDVLRLVGGEKNVVQVEHCLSLIHI